MISVDSIHTMTAPVAERLRALFLNKWIMTPLCLVWVRFPIFFFIMFFLIQFYVPFKIISAHMRRANRKVGRKRENPEKNT